MNAPANQAQVPPRPVDGNWLRWVNKHYPHDERWTRHLLIRRESPRPGTAEELDDLRGIAIREMAAELARNWFHIHSHADEIAAAHAAEKRQEEAKARVRLVKLAKQALDGKLGDSHSAREDARATALHYLRQAPEHCDLDELQDWEKMHAYTKQVAMGSTAKRPRLAADIKREAEQRRSLRDLDDSIGAVQASRPRMTQQGLSGV